MIEDLRGAFYVVLMNRNHCVYSLPDLFPFFLFFFNLLIVIRVYQSEKSVKLMRVDCNQGKRGYLALSNVHVTSPLYLRVEGMRPGGWGNNGVGK